MSKSFAGALSGVAILALAALASAQTTSSLVSEAELVTDAAFPTSNINGRVYTANLATCRDLVSNNPDLRFSWTLRTAYADGDLRFGVKAERPGLSCTRTSPGPEPNEDCLIIRDNVRVGSATELVADVFARTLLGLSSVDQCEGRQESYDVINVLPRVNVVDDQATHEPDVVRVRLETQRPAAPGGVTVQGGESSLLVEWDPTSSAEAYYVYLSSTPFAEGDVPEDVAGARRQRVTTGQSYRFTSGISAGVTYYITVTAEDGVGNESLLGETVTTTTEPTIDFWEDYLNRGGRETGGYCQQATGVTAVGLAAPVIGAALLLAAFARRRRRRWTIGSISLAAGLLVSGLGAPDAHAQRLDDDLLDVYDPESPIWGVIELRFGSYRPNIDSEFGGSGPYQSMFGGNGLLFEPRVDVHLYRGVGTVSLAMSAGYFNKGADAFNLDGTRSADRTRLTILPTRLSAVYRFDYLQHRFNVPFVFSARLGLDYSFWWVRAAGNLADGFDRDGTLREGRGGTAGWHYGLAIYFLLDWMAPAMARNFDNVTGINNTYLFVEYLGAQVNDFGGARSWDIGDRVLMFGIAFEL